MVRWVRNFSHHDIQNETTSPCGTLRCDGSNFNASHFKVKVFIIHYNLGISKCELCASYYPINQKSTFRQVFFLNLNL